MTDNNQLGAELNLSVHLARRLVESWLPPPSNIDKSEDEKIKDTLAQGRPSR